MAGGEEGGQCPSASALTPSSIPGKPVPNSSAACCDAEASCDTSEVFSLSACESLATGPTPAGGLRKGLVGIPRPDGVRCTDQLRHPLNPASVSECKEMDLVREQHQEKL